MLHRILAFFQKSSLCLQFHCPARPARFSPAQTWITKFSKQKTDLTNHFTSPSKRLKLQKPTRVTQLYQTAFAWLHLHTQNVHQLTQNPKKVENWWILAIKIVFFRQHGLKWSLWGLHIVFWRRKNFKSISQWKCQRWFIRKWRLNCERCTPIRRNCWEFEILWYMWMTL